MMRRPMQAPPMNGPRFNEWIQSPKVRVIDHEGENLGVMYTREAMAPDLAPCVKAAFCASVRYLSWLS